MVEYGWWGRKAPAPPATIGDSRNFTLYPAELAQYVEALEGLKQRVDAEHGRAKYALQAVTKGHVLSYMPAPHLFTLCDVLEFFVKVGKDKVRMMHFLSDLTKRRIP